MKKQFIKLATKKGLFEAEAYSTESPNLFIHHPCGEKSGWTISHMPSGHAIIPSVKKLQFAKDACKIFAQIPEWESLDPKSPETVKNFFEKNYKILCAGRDVALDIKS